MPYLIELYYFSYYEFFFSKKIFLEILKKRKYLHFIKLKISNVKKHVKNDS